MSDDLYGQWLRATVQNDRMKAALSIVPLDEWAELADEDLLDLIDRDVMVRFLNYARYALGVPSDP